MQAGNCPSSSGLHFPVRDCWPRSDRKPQQFPVSSPNQNSQPEIVWVWQHRIYTHTPGRGHQPHTSPIHPYTLTAVVWYCTRLNLITHLAALWLNRQPFSWFTTIGVRYTPQQNIRRCWCTRRRMDEWPNHAAVVWSCTKHNPIGYRAALWLKQ